MQVDASRGGAVPPPPPRSRTAALIPIAVAVATAALLAWSAWPTLRPVRTVEVVQAVFDRDSAPAPDEGSPGEEPRSSVVVQAAGWIEPEPFPIACAALADGVIATIEALEGDTVERGQVLATLVDDDARLEHARAEAEHAAAQAELTAAERDWAEPVERERAVEAGRAALAAADAELAQLPSMIEAARATLVRLEEERARTEGLRSGGAATEIEWIIAVQDEASQRAMVQSMISRGPILDAEVSRLRAELRAAERNLDLRIEERRRLEAARANAAAAKAALDTAALTLERMTIHAPMDGVVQRRMKAPGDKVMRAMDSPDSAQVMLLYDPARVQVRVDVPLADAAHVFVGQRCELVVEALPDRTFSGEVIRITHEADLQKNTLQAKVRVIDPSSLVRPETLTRVRFLPDRHTGRTPRDAADGDEMERVLVPTASIDEREGGRVWLVTDRRGDRGRLRPVQVERVGGEGDWAEVIGPVPTGAMLAVASDTLREGQHVRIAPRDTTGSAP